MEDFDFETLSQLMRSRRSVREYLPEPVPQRELEAVFESAGYAPSNCNSQPWKVVVVSGEKATKVKQVLMDTVGQGKIQMDYTFDDSLYWTEHKERQRATGALMYKAAGIAREDSETRQKFVHDNLNFFGSPHAAFFFLPEWGGAREAADVGLYAQNVMLAMRAKGIGSCPQALLSFNADAVRECLGVDSQFKLLFGLSFGYFDPERPLNQVRTERADVASSVDFQQ